MKLSFNNGASLAGSIIWFTMITGHLKFDSLHNKESSDVMITIEFLIARVTIVNSFFDIIL